ncbi:MAG: TonB-dependent receptor [Thermoanaerobaculia bacterium]|nr:TonB-dependent receptor [Thermoanaerobaculia bacterium]
MNLSRSPLFLPFFLALLLSVSIGPPSLHADDQPSGENVELVSEVSDEIVVLATRNEKRALEVPAHVTTIDFEQAVDDGFYAGADELRGQPGIFFRRSEGDNDAFLFVNFRGVTGNHGNDTFLALVDGIPFVNGDEEVLMSEIPYSAVRDVEIVRGPVSALYGRGGIGGAIAYSLGSTTDTHTDLRLAAGSDDYWNANLNLGRRFGEHGLFLSFDGVRAEGWREHNENQRLGLFGRLQLAPNDRTTISTYLNLHDRDFELGGVIPTLPDGTLVDVGGGRETYLGSRDIGIDSQSVMTAVRLSSLLGDSGLLQTTVHYRDRETDNVLDFYDFFGFDPSRNVMAVNGFDSDTEEQTAFLEATYDFEVGSTRTIVGASYERTDLVETDFWTGQFGFTFECGFAFYLIEIDYTTGAVLNRDHPCFVERQHNLSGDTENTFTSAFAQTEIELGDRVKLTLGARWDDFERKTVLTTGAQRTVQPQVVDSEDHVSPKLSLVFAASPEQTIYVNFGEGFSSNFGPVWQWDPSRYIRETRPTTLQSLELGTKGWVADGKLSYNLSLFSIEQEDRLVFVSNPEALTDFTVPSTIATTGQRFESQGFEATANYRFAPGSSLEARYGYVDAEWDELVVSTFTGPLDLSGTTPTGVPENTFYLAWRQQIGSRFDAGLSWEFYDDYAITQDNQFEGGSYDLLNLSLSYRPDLGALERIHLAVTNLLDEEYYFLFGGSRTAVTNAVPGVPLQARLSLSWAF